MRNKTEAGWVAPGWMNYLLLPLSWLYILLHGIKVFSYRIGFLQATRVGVPVIVVGAATAGGAGKTPLVIALAKHLKAQGYRPGVIARGYKGQFRDWPRLIEPDTPVSQAGDEALLIRVSSDVPMAAGPDRVEDARLLIDKCRCDVIVSDDGFQHLALHRDLNIVVIDSHVGFGNGWCLPAGPLREPLSGLKRADIRITNGSFGYAFAETDPVMEMEIESIRNLADGQLRRAEDFGRGPVHAVAALGNPERFFRQLESLGLEIVRHRFPDHYFYRAEDLDFDDALPILMTEKDAVKCSGLPSRERLWAVEARAVVHQEFYEQVEKKLDSSSGLSRESA